MNAIDHTQYQLTFSDATSADLSDVYRFHARQQQQFPQDLKERDHQALAAFIAAGNVIILGKFGHDIAGMVMVQLSQSTPEQQEKYRIDCGQAAIIEGYTAHQGLGIGGALLQKAVSVASEYQTTSAIFARVCPGKASHNRFLAQGFHEYATASDGKLVLRRQCQL